jgi:hypothetical protein
LYIKDKKWKGNFFNLILSALTYFRKNAWGNYSSFEIWLEFILQLLHPSERLKGATIFLTRKNKAQKKIKRTSSSW